VVRGRILAEENKSALNGHYPSRRKALLICLREGKDVLDLIKGDAPQNRVIETPPKKPPQTRGVGGAAEKKGLHSSEQKY